MFVVGLTDAFAEVEVNPLGLEVQEYVFPETDVAPILMLCPVHNAWFPPVLADGSGFTVMITESDALHPVAVMDSVTI